ncbi:hypothetical protein KHQ81_01425 [Mycoplasmatota bacterium]|nr:hypothetical protein KHQ81_01425 [Mycoplasmatota bacterium]
MRKGFKIGLTLFILFITITTFRTFAYTEPVVHDNLPNQSQNNLLKSSFFTHPLDHLVYNQPEVELSNYDILLENDSLRVYIDDESLALRVLNKETQYVWMSDLDNIYDERLNRDWVNFVRSAVSFSYFNSKEVVKYDDLIKSKRDITIEKTVQSDQVRFDLDFTYTKIKLSLIIKLDGNALSIKIPKESIEEYGKNKLFKLQLYPFLGATKFDEIPGYSFIPDGSGALVRFQKNNIMKSSFKTRFFGNDIYLNPVNNDILPFNLPVYGMVHGHNQNAIFSEVTSGAQFGEFIMQFAGNTTDFNFNYVNFLLREKYFHRLIDDQGISKITEDRYLYDIEVIHNFLSNEKANYIGMAQTYQDSLFYNDEKLKTDTKDIPMHLDVIAADSYQSILFQKYVKMTTLDELVSINNELKDENINELLFTYKGYNKGGLSKINLNNYQFDRRLRNQSSLDKLDNMYLYYEPSLVYEKEADKKYLLQQINQNYVLIDDYYYYNNNKSILKGIQHAKEYATDIGTNIALDGVSNLLYSDLKNNITREEMIKRLNEKIVDDIPMYKPASYLLNKTSDYLNTANSSNQYLFITDSVPFVQTLLRGYVNYYSENINNSGNRTSEILRCVEYGTYPSYLISNKSSYYLKNEIFNDIFGIEYDLYRNLIADEYHYVNEALKHVIDSKIISHHIVHEGLVEVTYDNGIIIIVNYNNQEMNYLGKVIEGKNYIVIGDQNE